MRYLKFTFFGIAAVLAITFLSNCNKEEAAAPVASFTFSVSELTASFTSSSTDADTYAWDFGDGTTSAEENPSHTYEANGTYSVVLTVENAEGSDSETQSVTVEATPNASSPELSFGDADGAFYAINTVNVTSVAGFETTINVGAAVSWFVNGGSDFVDVGAVSFSQGSFSGTLDKQDNNAYTYAETAVPTSGFGTSGGVEWTIAGGNGHSAISGLTNPYPFPSTKKIAETASNISGSADYTLMHDGAINNADSTYYSIYGANGSVLKRVAGSTTSAMFTAAEMSSLGQGTAILQIASFSIQNQTLASKKYYMVNESVATKIVTID